MKDRFPGMRARSVALMFIAGLLVVTGLFATELVSRYRWAFDTLDTLEPRYARLKGVQQVGTTILDRRREADSALLRVAYAADMETGRIGTDLQQRVRQIADALDIQVSGSQILPAREEGHFVIVTVSGTLAGETGALASFLAALANEEPPVIVEKLVVQAPRQGRRGESNVQVNVQAQMSVLRVRP